MWDRGVSGSSLIGDTVLCPCARNFICFFVRVQPKKTGNCLDMTEKLLTGMKASTQTKTYVFLIAFVVLANHDKYTLL